MPYPGKPSTTGHVLTWDGTKPVFQAVAPPADTTVPQGEWRRSFDRTLQRRSYEDIIYHAGSSASQTTTALIYDDPRTTFPTRSTNPARIAILNPLLQTLTTVAFSTAVVSVNAEKHIVNTASSIAWGTFSTHYNDDPTVGATGTYFFATEGSLIKRYRENPAGGLTLLDSVTLSGARAPYFDGRHMWTITGTEVRRLTGFFGAASSFALDATVYGTHSTFSRDSWYATDGLFTYLLVSNKIYKLNQLTLASTNAVVSGDCLSFDGRYLWIGSFTSMRTYEPSTLALVASYSLPSALDSASLSGATMLETVYDGMFIWVVHSTTTASQHTHLRFDPISKQVVSGTAGGNQDRYRSFKVVPSDRCPGVMTYVKDVNSGAVTILMCRELNDVSPATIEINNTFYGKSIGAIGVSGTFSLPANVPDSFTYIVKRFGGSLTVNTTDGSTIDGVATSVYSTNLESRTFVRYGGNWYRIS